jgi:hypothetical protein
MVTNHLTDEEIQHFVFEPAEAEGKIAGHIQVCIECRARAETYQLLIKGILHQPTPAFDFDLSAAVLKQLPAPVHRHAGNKILNWIIILICTGLIGTASYFFRSYADSLFRGIAGIGIYLMAISAITIIALLFIEMYKKYQKEMSILDLH